MLKSDAKDLVNKFQILFNPSEQKKLFVLFAGMLLMGFFEMAGVASILPFMAVVTDQQSIKQNKYLNFFYNEFGFTDNQQFLIALGILVLVVLAVSNIYNAFMQWWSTRYVYMQGHRLSMQLLKHYLSQPYAFFLNRNTADMGKNVLSEVDRIIGGVIMPGVRLMGKLVMSVFILSLLFTVDPFLATTTWLVLGGSYWIIFRSVNRKLISIGVASTTATLGRFKIAHEAMSGIKELKVRGTELEFLNQFASHSEATARYKAQSSLISLLPRYGLETIAFGGIVTITIFLMASGYNSEEVIPLISLYALAGYRLMPALQQIYQGVTAISFNLPAMNILVADLARPGEKDLKDKAHIKPLPFNHSIKIEKLRFNYHNVDKPTLSDLYIEIKANTTIALVGSTGAGKTTLADILLGLLSPQSGQIFVDEIEITNENFSSWQQNLGYVPQSIYLTDDTLMKNIAFGVPEDEINIDGVIRAAKLAELDDFIQALPDGYQTFVGERGVRLSGGQRQRVGIARALYYDPKVLILDEATSALDGYTENVIMSAIHNLSHKITIIVIAHRLSTVEECDVVHLVNNMKISDSGTYEELLSRNKQFRKMAREQ